MFYTFNIPEGTTAKTFINAKIGEGFIFYSLYAERSVEGYIQCKWFNLPEHTTIDDFIDYLEGENWDIQKATFSGED